MPRHIDKLRVILLLADDEELSLWRLRVWVSDYYAVFGTTSLDEALTEARKPHRRRTIVVTDRPGDLRDIPRRRVRVLLFGQPANTVNEDADAIEPEGSDLIARVLFRLYALARARKNGFGLLFEPAADPAPELDVVNPVKGTTRPGRSLIPTYPWVDAETTLEAESTAAVERMMRLSENTTRRAA